MDINLSGNIYIHFIKSVFQSNRKIGIEIFIDKHKSDKDLISSLTRLNLLKINKLFIENENIKNKLDMYNNKYICNITITIVNNNQIILENLKYIENDKTNKIIDNKLFVPKYSCRKNKAFQQIMNIIYNT